MSVVHVHHRGDRGVDGILRLIELASHDGPIESTLCAMCDEVAAIADVDIASVYVREYERRSREVQDDRGERAALDRLVMRGNHGFPRAAIGVTALAVGEGITGLVAECMRPVSAAHAAAEAAYKHVPGLGEERFPVFAGVPLIGGGAVIGVLVMQRRTTAFTPDEITLATALGAPVTLAIERRRAAEVRSARLHGLAHVGGSVLGRAAAVATSTALAHASFDLDRAVTRLRDDLARAVRRLGDSDAPAVGAALDRLALALCDQRLRERLAAAADSPTGLRSVARDYARARYRLGTAGDSADHASEIEQLCVLLADTRALRPGAIWIADRIGAFVAIAAVARGAAALVAGDAVCPAAIAIARAAELPTVSDVPGLFGWARPDDLLAVDGDTGTVLIHPAPAEIERLRQSR